MELMTFEDALRALRTGQIVRRKSWSYGTKLSRNAIINLDIKLSWDDLNASDWMLVS